MAIVLLVLFRAGGGEHLEHWVYEHSLCLLNPQLGQ